MRKNKSNPNQMEQQITTTNYLHEMFNLLVVEGSIHRNSEGAYWEHTITVPAEHPLQTAPEFGGTISDKITLKLWRVKHDGLTRTYLNAKRKDFYELFTISVNDVFKTWTGANPPGELAAPVNMEMLLDGIGCFAEAYNITERIA
jgi:hypothetical protein